MREEILAAWNPWWSGRPGSEYVGRDLVEGLDRWIERREILAFLGVRRSGKTTIMKILIERLLESGTRPENILFVKCDDDRVEKSGLVSEAMATYRELMNPEGRVFVFLDEVQDIPRWEETLKRIYDLEEATKLFISGSTSSMIKERIGSRLAGRIAHFTVHPFSFREFIGTRMQATDTVSLLSRESEVKHNLRDYMEFGGFPEVALERDEATRRQLLRFYHDTIVYRDIVMQRSIRNVAKMESLIGVLLQNVSNPVNYTRIGKAISLSTDTVGEYVRYFQEAFFLFTVPVFSPSVRTQEINPKKTYCIDSGLRNARGFRFSEDLGRLMENVVFVELNRRMSADPLAGIFYWKDKAQHEVDFLVKKGTNVAAAIQVCWNVTDAEVEKREVQALLSAMDAFALKEGLIITWDREGDERTGGRMVRFVPLWKWLLSKEL